MGSHKVRVYFHVLLPDYRRVVDDVEAVVETRSILMDLDLIVPKGQSHKDIIVTMAKQYCDLNQVVFSHVEEI